MENCIFLHEKNLIWKINFSDFLPVKLFHADFFKINKSGNAIFYYANKIYTYDFQTNKKYFLMEAENLRLLDLSENIYIILSKNIFYVYSIDNQLVEKIEGVQYGRCSHDNYAYIKNNILFFCINQKIMQKLENILQFEISNDVLTVHNSKNEIVIYRGADFLHKWEIDNIVNCKFNIFNDEMVIAEVISNYTEGRYYGDKKLYIYNLESGKANMIRKLPMIHDVKYFDEKLYICHGKQPAAVDIYGKEMKYLGRHSVSSRNLLVLNRTYDLFAGLGNLSGTVEIYDKEKGLVSQVKKLGVSRALWSPCNTYFILATLNDMQVDNGIIIYDFYSNKIIERSFESLSDVFVCGTDFNLKKLSPAKKPNFLQKKSTFTFKRI